MAENIEKKMKLFIMLSQCFHDLSTLSISGKELIHVGCVYFISVSLFQVKSAT